MGQLSLDEHQEVPDHLSIMIIKLTRLRYDFMVKQAACISLVEVFALMIVLREEFGRIVFHYVVPFSQAL